MKKKSLLVWLLSLFLLASPAWSQDEDDELDDLAKDFRVGIEGSVNVNGIYSKENKESINLKESYVSLSVEWRDKIRAVLTTKLESLFKENKLEFNDNFEIQEFIKEAYIEIREIAGKPIAVIIGKQPIAFGQNVQAMPMFKENPLAELLETDEVMGITLDLEEGLFGVFDQVEVSVFESKAGDLEVGKIDGVSVRLSKMIVENWYATVSHMEKGNSHLNTGHERRTSVGLIVESRDGNLVGWVEGVYFSNNPQYLESNFAVTAGFKVKVHQAVDVVVEYSYVDKQVHQFGVGVNVALTKNLSAGIDARYNNYVEKKDDFQIGLALTYTFGSSGYNQNEDYLFFKDDSENNDVEDLDRD